MKIELMNTIFKASITSGIIVASLFSSPKNASAAIVQVFTPGSLSGTTAVEDFEDNTFIPGVNFSAASGVQIVTSGAYAGSVTPSGTQGLAGNSFPDPITISFTNAVSSAGFFFGNDDTCCSAVFTANLDIFNGATLLGTISATANMNDFADQFLGFNTTAGETVTSMTIRYGSGSDVGLYTYIDDVRFAQAPTQSVPEPFTIVGTLIGGTAALRMRKKLKSNAKV
jgi:hypothetical protein